MLKYVSKRNDFGYVGILAPASTVAYNDAEWIAGAKGFRTLHPSISQTLAQRVGCPSLRYLYAAERENSSNAILARPPQDVIKAQLHLRGLDFAALRADSQLSVQLLMEFVNLGMVFGASAVHFMFDPRQYKAQSLLQSQLADYQGASVLIHFADCVLSPNDVALHHLPCEQDKVSHVH